MYVAHFPPGAVAFLLPLVYIDMQKTSSISDSPMRDSLSRRKKWGKEVSQVLVLGRQCSERPEVSPALDGAAH